MTGGVTETMRRQTCWATGTPQSELLPCENLVRWHTQPGPKAKLQNAKECLQLILVARKSHLISTSIPRALRVRKGQGLETNRSGLRLWPPRSAAMVPPREAWMVIRTQESGSEVGICDIQNQLTPNMLQLLRPSSNSSKL